MQPSLSVVTKGLLSECCTLASHTPQTKTNLPSLECDQAINGSTGISHAAGKLEQKGASPWELNGYSANAAHWQHTRHGLIKHNYNVRKQLSNQWITGISQATDKMEQKVQPSAAAHCNQLNDYDNEQGYSSMHTPRA